MYHQVKVRDIIFHMLQERSKDHEKDVQNYLADLIVQDYHKKEALWQKKKES